MFRLLPEREADGDEVEALLDLAFAPGRTALSSYRLREGVPPAAGLCRIARDEYDALVGCIRYWPVRIGERRPGDPARLVASSERAEKELGWRAEHSDIETIVASAWRYYESRRAARDAHATAG